jgi:hypothetical protein
MEPIELGGWLLTVEGISALFVQASVAGAVVGVLLVLATLMYGRR